MRSEEVSGRQLWVAVLVGGLSHAAAFAGGTDWRWVLAATPVSVLLGYLLLRRARARPLFQGAGGRVLAAAYGGWAVVLLAVTLRRAAERIHITNANRTEVGWILLLIVVPLLYMGRGKRAAFFRVVEIFWLAALVLAAAVTAFAVPHIRWSWLLTPGVSRRESVAAATLILTTQLFILPYIYKVEGGRKELLWQGGLGVAAGVLLVLTVGVLSSAVASQMDVPFFIASGVLGGSVRGEGLISALWLLPDLTLAGLLSRVWKGRYGPVLAVVLGSVLALSGLTNFFSTEILAFGMLILTVLTLVLPGAKE